jgi:hypothetical protein
MDNAMQTTPSESRIIQLLRQRRVSRFIELAKDADVSLKTVFRTLSKVGYHTSVNANSTYATLRDIPQFDARGLWVYRQVCFSRFGSLRATIRSLIEHSSDGCTVEELQLLLRTRVHNHLSSLLAAGEIGKFHAGRHTVYTAHERAVQRKQEASRQQAQLAAPVPAHTVPTGMDAITVIQLLIQLLRRPKASSAELATLLQAQGIQMDREHVQRVLTYYDLKKTKQAKSSN